MPIRLLLSLKLRLLTRSLTAGNRQGSIFWAMVTGFLLFLIGVMFSPASYLAVTDFGGRGLVVVFGFIQIGWVATSFIFGTFGEAFPPPCPEVDSLLSHSGVDLKSDERDDRVAYEELVVLDLRRRVKTRTGRIECSYRE